MEKGALSVARDGREVVISLGPALALDPTHQVRSFMCANLQLLYYCPLLTMQVVDSSIVSGQAEL